MRFNEFKLTEAKSNDFYTVGDSHAKGVGTASGLSAATNLAVDGAAAHGRGRGREMLANIVKIPKGANVLISVGANDTADVVKQNVDSQGKTKLPPVSKIVGDVMKVVNAVKEQSPNKIVFMLFPNGDNKKTTYYAGDYQKACRQSRCKPSCSSNQRKTWRHSIEYRIEYTIEYTIEYRIEYSITGK